MELPESIIRLLQFDTKEKINIVTNKVYYPISKSLAVVISPLFSNIIKTNPTIKAISFPIDERIQDFFKEKSIDRKLFLIMSIQLDNQEFIKKWKRENELNKETVIDRLMTFINYNGKIENMTEEIDFIGKHFEELENQLIIEKIPSNYLSEISKNIKEINSEKKIFKYIIKRLKEENDEEMRKKLIESIKIGGLTDEDIKELIENVKSEDLSETIFSVLKELYLSTYRKNKEITKELDVNKQKLQKKSRKSSNSSK